MNYARMLTLNIPAQAEKLCLIRALVRRACELAGCDNELAEKLVIALNEACMNVIQHAYTGDAAGEITLEIHNNEGLLVFELKDQASPVDLDSVRPRDLEDVRPGGLGTHFIREIMDECTMGHLEEGSGNFLRMTKKIN